MTKIETNKTNKKIKVNQHEQFIPRNKTVHLIRYRHHFCFDFSNYSVLGRTNISETNIAYPSRNKKDNDCCNFNNSISDTQYVSVI